MKKQRPRKTRPPKARKRPKKKSRRLGKRPAGTVVLPDPMAMEGWIRNQLLAAPGGGSADYRAQQMMYDAWETPDRGRRVALARKALEMWPDCADAWELLAEDATATPEDALNFYEQGVQAGERALGKRAFKDDAGHFWGILETRPYMRAHAGLASMLESLGRPAEAIEHYRDLLRLNPNDNQGIRYSLLRAFIAAGRDDEAAKLLKRFDDAMAAGCIPKR